MLKKNGMPGEKHFSSINDLTDCAMSCPVDYADALQRTRWFPHSFVRFFLFMSPFLSFSLSLLQSFSFAFMQKIVRLYSFANTKKNEREKSCSLHFSSLVSHLSSSSLCTYVCRLFGFINSYT